MTGMEKVVKGLETHTDLYVSCKDCPYMKQEDVDRYCEYLLMKDVLKVLKEQPEIVRCKYCKWFSEKGFCKHPDGGAGNIRPADWFCADGKRREVE